MRSLQTSRSTHCSRCDGGVEPAKLPSISLEAVKESMLPTPSACLVLARTPTGVRSWLSDISLTRVMLASSSSSASSDDIIDEELWNTEVVISRQTQGEKISLKILQIKGESKFRLKSESINLVSEG